MQKEKKKLYYKILKALYPDPGKKVDEKIQIEELEKYIESKQKFESGIKDDAKTLSIVLGLTQKKVKEICKEKGYKLHKEPHSTMFGLDKMSDEKVNEMLALSELDLSSWYMTNFRASRTTQTKNDGKIEYIDSTLSYENIDLACVSLEYQAAVGIRAHAVWSLQEITQMIKEGRICDLCVVAKTKDGTAITVIPETVSEGDKSKIINTVFDSLKNKKSSLILN